MSQSRHFASSEHCLCLLRCFHCFTQVNNMNGDLNTPALAPSEDIKEVSGRKAAEILKVAPATLKKLDIPYRQYKYGGRCYYRLSDLHQYIDKHSFNL